MLMKENQFSDINKKNISESSLTSSKLSPLYVSDQRLMLLNIQQILKDERTLNG